jgi:purine-binding chemotaxis protein CheW
LQEELAAKSSSIEESFPEPSFSEESFADERATAKLPTLPDDTSDVSAIGENNQENKLETENATHDEILSQNGFNKFTSLDEETDEMPETALFEKLAARFSESEMEYPEDLPESILPTSLGNELNDLPDALSDEMPEALLLKNSSRQIPEFDSAGFDQLPEPTFEEVDLPLPETSVGSTLNTSEQNSADQNVVPDEHSLKEKFSFLEERFVIFKLDDTLYAFPAVNVAEIGQLLPITPLPFVPSWFLGISHLRGDILSVVGLRELWKKNTAPSPKAKILIVHSEKQSLTVALVVDAVREMRHVTPEEIISDESQGDSHFASYQIGMVEYEGQNLCLLNAEKLLETLRS